MGVCCQPGENRRLINTINEQKKPSVQVEKKIPIAPHILIHQPDQKQVKDHKIIEIKLDDCYKNKQNPPEGTQVMINL